MILARMLRTAVLGAFATVFCAHAAHAADNVDTSTIPLKDFARHPAMGDPAMSPDGKYVAVRVDDPNGWQHSVVVYQIDGMKVASILKMPKFQIPLNITWVSDTQLVIEKGKAEGALSIPTSIGEIISSRFDGTHQKYLYGNGAMGRRAVTRQDEGFGFIDGLPRNPNGHFYMYVYPWNSEHVSQIYDVGVDENTRHLISDIGYSGMDFLIDNNGQATYSYGVGADQKFRIFHRSGNDWIPLPDSVAGVRFKPFTYSPDGKKMFVWSSPKGGPYQLVQANADASDQQTMMADPFSSFANLQYSPRPYKLFAVTSGSGIPKPIYINASLPSAKLYQALSNAFKGQFVDFINFSQDGKRLLFSTTSDRNPGTYYLIDRTNNKVVKLFDAAPWLHPGQMSERRPFRFKASDGTELEGILTLPKGRAQSNLPMVLMPHGGPYDVQDSWFFDDDAQMLASRGYLVLQVNFRGSGGRGPRFVQSGYKQWGTRIQQDLTDGVKWAIAQHFADPQRICVYGGSFGGYSALMQVIREPKLYKCAVGYDGVYDLNMQAEKSDTAEFRSGRNYFAMVLGKTKKIRASNSPVDLVDKIEVPVFLIHGKDDKRVPYAEATDMRDALEKAGKKVEWMAKSGEGHGFYNEDNNLERFTKLLAFLKQNIGPGAPVVNTTQNTQ